MGALLWRNKNEKKWVKHKKEKIKQGTVQFKCRDKVVDK